MEYDVNGDGIVDIADIQRLIAAGQFSFQLSNYPNPFNPTTTIQFYLPVEMPVEIKIYNMMGKLVKQIVDDKKDAGYHSIVWDGKDETGVSIGSGMYFYTVEIEGYREVNRMILLK